ncbi:MAG: hypothetical protein ACOCQD_02895 [archaeon]
MKIFYTKEAGVYGKFLDIQIVNSKNDVNFGGKYGFPFIVKVETSERRKELVKEIFQAYKIKYKRKEWTDLY